MTPRHAAFVIVAVVACLALEAEAPQQPPPAKNEIPAPKPAVLRGKVELTLNHPLREPLSASMSRVLVHISPPPEGIKYQAPSEPAIVTLKTSVGFIPRVIGVQCGQWIHVEPDGTERHNVHPLPKNTRYMNHSVGRPERPQNPFRYVRAELDPPVMVKCDVHHTRPATGQSSPIPSMP